MLKYEYYYFIDNKNDKHKMVTLQRYDLTTILGGLQTAIHSDIIVRVVSCKGDTCSPEIFVGVIRNIFPFRNTNRNF